MIDSNVTHILRLPPERWARFLLYTSPVAANISTEEASHLITLALQVGREASRKISVSLSASDFAERLGIPIVYDENSQPGIRFAECRTRRKKTIITVFKENLLRVQLSACKAIVKNSDIDFEPLQLILWHELFHGMEQMSLYTELLNTRVEIHRFGSFVRTSRLRSLSEIGAMAFACSAGRFPFNPLILDYWLLASYDKQEADRFVCKILQI